MPPLTLESLPKAKLEPTKMPTFVVETILPLAALLMPPEKLLTKPPTRMPDWTAEIVPLFAIPAPLLP